MAQDRIGELEHIVLLAILRLGDHAYGVTIAEELDRHTHRSILRPSIYIALRRLKKKGLVRSRMGEPKPTRGGRARQYFELCPEATEILRDSRSTFQSLWKGLGSELEVPK